MKLMDGLIFFSLIFLCIFCFLVMPIIFLNDSFAQWMLQPLPAPKPDQNICCTYLVNKSDIFPPKIFIESDKLVEGTTVLKIKIMDDSPLKNKALIYTKGNKNITTYLAKSHTGEYSALVKVSFPETLVKVNAVDTNGNSATVIKKIMVTNNPLLSFLKFIEHFFEMMVLLEQSD